MPAKNLATNAKKLNPSLSVIYKLKTKRKKKKKKNYISIVEVLNTLK